MRTVQVGDVTIGDGHPPRVMGVVNLSPQSPYDPSVFSEPAAAAAYADGLIEEGADIVDIGLESANKRFEVRSADWELDRLDLAIETVRRTTGDAVFSIETRYSEVADRALSAGFDMVNDICGFADPAMPDVCEAHDVPVVKMAGPGDLERPGALATVDDIYAALAGGRLTGKTIVDPAFGGWSEDKTLAADRETFDRLREFRALGRPILVSINRKNFLRTLAGRSTEDALPVSLAATSMAIERGANVIRTHDVAATRDAAIVGHAFSRGRARTDRVRELDLPTPMAAARHLDRLGLDRDLADRSVARGFELRDLTDRDRRRLRAAARESGAVLALSRTAGFLAGSVASLRAFADALDGRPADVDEAIRTAIDP